MKVDIEYCVEKYARPESTAPAEPDIVKKSCRFRFWRLPHQPIRPRTTR